MRCPHCNEKTAVHDLWCIKCGKHTELISKDLSAIKSLKATWSNYKAAKGHNLPAGIYAALTGVIPMLGLIWLLNFALKDMLNLHLAFLSNIIWTLFLPVMLVPFSAVCRKDDYSINTKEFINSFKAYFSYFILSLCTVIYYLIIYLLCQGDPILNLVWLVLVLYWIAIIVPVPVLMQRFNCNAVKAVKIAYKQAGDVRWNIFLMVIILFIINVIATLFLFVGLAITIPFTWFAIRDYIDRLIEFEVIHNQGN